MITSSSRTTAAVAAVGVALCLVWIVLGHRPPARPATGAHLLLAFSGLLAVAVAVPAARLVPGVAHQVSTARRAQDPDDAR